MLTATASQHIRSGLGLAGFLVCLAVGLLPANLPAEDAEGKPAKTREVVAGDLKLQIPESWEQKDPASRFRTAQFEIPPAEGDEASGEFVIFYFGEQGAGGAQANVDRWINQFEPEGRKVRTFTGKSAQGEYTLVDLTGTYKKPIGPPIQMKSKSMPGWRMLGVILQTEKGPYFLKFDAPAKTIAASESAYRAAIGADPKAEKEVKKDEKKEQE